ncbi:hypothetical protein [Streptomyces sp. NPDC026659]|uniref:hypothetical protein n=1 Tax=Streptomyces sp. NPDC026659 TaxID=3155123 RepID=UPI0033C39B0F
MTFPNTPLATKTELFVDGAWADISNDVYERDPITITRGRTAQGEDVDPSRCTLTLNNTSGKYSPRNPVGTYYGKIGRNTPLRVSVMAGSVALDLPGATGDYASTPDDASLDVTGDIDIRFDATLSNWTDPQGDTSGLKNIELIAKLGASPQKSWMFAIRGYKLYFEWSADGSNVLSASSTIPLPAGPDTRMAVRVTLDVDNGASGNTVTFYTADTLSGTWVQLGDVVTQSGTTSIFNSTTALRIGDATAFVFGPAKGSVHAAQVRNGIAGTVVANPDFSAQASGATSFSDSAGRTWTLAGNASITNRKVRFVGEVSEWPAEWDVSGKDVYTQVTASGILRRLSQGNSPIKSTLTRRIPTLGPLAYWPMEDGANSTVAYSPIKGIAAMTTSGLTFAANGTLAGSSALPTLNSGAVIDGIVPAPSSTQTSWQVEFVYNLDATTTAYRTLMVINCGTGTVRTWYLQISGNTLARVLGYDEDGTLVVNDARSVGSDLSDGRWNRWQHRVSVSGGTVTYVTTWTNIGGAGGTATGTYSGSIGTVVGVGSPDSGYSSELGSMAIGHVSVFSPSQSTAYNSVDTGQNGERAGVRLARLAGEESIAMSVCGDTSIQAQQGPQRPATVLEILRDCAEADGGILYEQRAAAGLIYRDKSTLFNQRVRLALNYQTAGHVAPPFKPVDDDQLVKNEITVTRKDGASAVSELTTGALSTQAPPNGVGRYQDSQELNLYDDTQPAQAAEWLLYLGTWDEARYPTLHVDLAAGPSLIDDVTAADVGDRATVSNPPSWLPPDSIDLLVQGYTEVIKQLEWDITYNCTPGGPWSYVAQAGTARADTSGSHLVANASAAFTDMYVVIETGPLWVNSIDSPSDFPFDVNVEGERVRVNTCTGTEVDHFGRTVSNDWGTADVGGTWSLVGGVASDYSVSSGVGNHTLSTVDVSRRCKLGPVVFNDFDLYTSVKTSALATGGFLSGGLVARYVDGDNLYTARVAFNTDQTVTLSIRERLTATETELATVTKTGLVHAAGTWFRLRFYGAGTSLKAKIWLATDTEPDVWDLQVTDTTFQDAGIVGMRSISSASNTNTNPVVSYDDFENVVVQRWSVTRSINGVSKNQVIGADVHLWDRAYVPLDWGTA